MTTSVEYSFTVTLLPKIYKYPAEQQYDITYIHLMHILEGLSHAFTLVAEITHSCNLHYHGIIRYYNFKAKENLTKKFYDAFRGSNIFGHVNIKQIDNLEGWIDYLCKETVETKDALNRPPILKDHFNYIICKYSDFALHSGLMQYDFIEEQ